MFEERIKHHINESDNFDSHLALDCYEILKSSGESETLNDDFVYIYTRPAEEIEATEKKFFQRVFHRFTA